MSTYKDHLKAARHYLEGAYELLERGDPYDAAEKIWATVKRATTALTAAALGEAAPLKERLLEVLREGSLRQSRPQRGGGV